MREKNQSFVSIVIPTYNEEESVKPLYERLKSILSNLDYSYEIIFVDDGSTDKSFFHLKKLSKDDKHVKVIELSRNFGQTAAISAGIDHAVGNIIVLIDADLQNDPEDIPSMLKKIEEGYDLVSGWRINRKDSWLTRILPSRIANLLISKVTSVHLHDYGCTLKAYRREILNELKLYGEMHRFLPALTAQVGARIVEVPVSHHPRCHGKSKYGLERTLKVLLDLFTVKFLGTYAKKPIHLFGGVGSFMMASGIILLVYLIMAKFLHDRSMVESPLLLMSIMFFILGINAILLGLMAELIVRTYYESQNKPTYVVRKVFNISER